MKSRKTIGILQILIILFLGTAAITYVPDDSSLKNNDGAVPAGNTQTAAVQKPRTHTGNGKINIIPSPSQTEAETPSWANEATARIEELGQNLALKKAVSDNGFNDVYESGNVTDGVPQTYWEGEPAGYPNIITVDLGTSKSVSKIRVRLNPEVVWSKRVQNFSVLISSDGKEFKEKVAAKDYEFDPKTGNMVLVTLEPVVETQYVQLQFTKNSGASAAQLSEFEIY